MTGDGGASSERRCWSPVVAESSAEPSSTIWWRRATEHSWSTCTLPHRPDVPWTRADLTDAGQALEVLSGIDDRWERPDALVHLAAVAAPGRLPDATLFATNITTTYNVFAAARRVGVRDVVWASSETVLGLPLTVPPPSFPLDEDTVPTPTTSYSLVQDPRGGDGPPVRAVDARSVFRRPSAVQRHGRLRLRGVPGLR